MQPLVSSLVHIFKQSQFVHLELIEYYKRVYWRHFADGSLFTFHRSYFTTPPILAFRATLHIYTPTHLCILSA